MEELYKELENRMQSKVAKYTDSELLRERAICDRILTLYALKSNRLGPDQIKSFHENSLEFYYIERRLGNL